MTRPILSTFFSLILFLGIPMMAKAAPSVDMEIIDYDVSNVAISVQGNVLHVVGANGQMLSIYNVTGVRVSTFRVEGADKRYDLNLAKGCYIVKVGKTVRKISIS